MSNWLTRLDPREQDEVILARYYVKNLDHGTSGHLAKTVNAKMADLLDAADSPVPTSSITVDGYSLPVSGQPKEWYFANNHRPTWVDKDKPHSGVDLNLLEWPRGDIELGYPVFATANGLVVYAQYAPGNYWGNLVITVSSYSQGLLFWRYAHLDGVAVDVGDILAAGDALGTIGKGANDRYAAHLHLDCWRGAMTVAPGAWFDRRVTWLDPLVLWDGKWEWGSV